jgi:hypothetical protein
VWEDNATGEATGEIVMGAEVEAAEAEEDQMV